MAPLTRSPAHRTPRWLPALFAAALFALPSAGCISEPAPDTPDADPEPDPQPDMSPEAPAADMRAAPDPDLGEAPPDAAPEPDADPDGAPEPPPEPCPEDGREGDACGEEGAECDYPKGECPCGDPRIAYVCQDGALAELYEEFGCEYAADECNPPVCDGGPGAACEVEGESCWFEDGLDDETGLILYRRWICEGGALAATDETHINGI